jgi:proteasome lid subunit RPN8/RPN11
LAAEHVFTLRNVAERPEIEFIASVQDQMALNTFLEKGWELFGLFHSHPKTDPTPSETDVLFYYYSEVPMVIVSVKKGGLGWTVEVRAWMVDGESIREEVIEYEN